MSSKPSFKNYLTIWEKSWKIHTMRDFSHLLHLCQKMSANVGISVSIHICTWSGPKSETLFMVDGLCGYRCLHAWCCLCLNSTYVLANEYLFEAHQSPMEKLTQMFGSFIAHKYQQHLKSPIKLLPKKLNLYVLLI